MERNYSQTRIQTFTQIEETTITAFLFTIQRSPSCLPYRTKSRFQALDIFQHSTTLLSRTFVIFLIMSLYKNIATGPKIVNRVEENEKKMATMTTMTTATNIETRREKVSESQGWGILGKTVQCVAAIE